LKGTEKKGYEAPAGQRFLPPGIRLIAVTIDLVATAIVLWLGLATTLSVLLGIDNAIRLHIIGQTPSVKLIAKHKPMVDYAALRADIVAHPLILGRPMLQNLLTIIGSAAILLLFSSFIGSICGERSLGGFLVDLRQRRIDRSLSGALERSLAEAAKQLRHRVVSRILERLQLKNWLEMLGSLREVLGPLKSLPSDARTIGLVTIAIAIAISVATPIFLNSHAGLAHLTFTAPDGNSASIARASLYISLAAVAVAWAAAITGASLTSPWLLLLMAMFYVFTIAFVGLAGGRAWWVVAPQWAMVIVAATSPTARRMRHPAIAVVWVLSALAVFHTFRLTPLAIFKTGAWPWIKSWPTAAVIATAATPVFMRAKIEFTLRRTFVAVAALTVGFLALSLRAGEQPVAESLYYSISILMSFLVVFWFLLGRNLVLPCLATAKAAVAQASRALGLRAMPRLLVAACLIELAVIAIVQRLYPDVDQSSSKFAIAIPAHQGLVLMILTMAAIMSALGALSPRRAMWLFAVWAFSLMMTIAYFGAQLAILNPKEATNITGQIQGEISGMAELGGMILLTLGVVLEIFAGHRQLTGGDESDTPPGVMLTYLGVLALFAALTHLVLVSKTYSPDGAAAYTYEGMSLMWPAIAVLAALTAINRATADSRGSIALALIAGAIASAVTDLIRHASGNPASIGLMRQLIAVASGELVIVGCVALIVRRNHRLTALDSIAIGLACAFGFVVAYVGELVVPILAVIIGVPSYMSRFSPGIALTEKWLHYLPFGAQGNPVPHADLMIFYVLVPAIAALAGFSVWSWVGGNVSMRIPAIMATSFVASLLYSVPLFENSILIAGFGREAHTTPLYVGMIEDAYIKATAYLAIPAILIAAFIYSNLRHQQMAPRVTLTSEPAANA